MLANKIEKDNVKLAFQEQKKTLLKARVENTK